MFVRDMPGIESLTEKPLRPSKSDIDKQRATKAEQATAAEAARLDRRSKLKEQLLQAALAEDQRMEVMVAIAAINERKDTLASEHAVAAMPLQEELNSIEAQQINGIRQRITTDPDLEKRRQSLLSDLRQMNSDLEANIANEDRLLKQLESERLECAKKCNTSSIESELFQCASQPLRIACEVARSGLNWATARFEKARQRHGDHPSPGSEAELNRAGLELDRARSESDAAYAACVNE